MGKRYKIQRNKDGGTTPTRMWMFEMRNEEIFRRNEGNNGECLHLRARIFGFSSPRDLAVIIAKKIGTQMQSRS